MNDYRNQMNKWDYIVPIASGAMTAALDIFWVKDKFLARAWSGYTSTKRSGNEYAQAGDGWRGDDAVQ